MDQVAGEEDEASWATGGDGGGAAGGWRWGRGEAAGGWRPWGLGGVREEEPRKEMNGSTQRQSEGIKEIRMARLAREPARERLELGSKFDRAKRWARLGSKIHELEPSHVPRAIFPALTDSIKLGHSHTQERRNT